MTNTAQTNWVIDPAHSEIQFKVKHLVISTVTGSFKRFNANMKSKGESFEGAELDFDAEISSIDTNAPQRDEHLKSADFFDAANHPKMSFRSTSFTKKDGDSYELKGDLSIRGVTKPITLDVEFGGIMTDPYGQTKAGFELSGKIRRKEFGLTWDAVTETGGVVVSDEVKLIASVQMIKQG